MTRRKTIQAPTGYPLFGWSRQTIRAHLDQNPPRAGVLMIIYNSHGGLHQYSLATIENPFSGGQERVILSKAGISGGQSFYSNGTNTFTPKGQSVMLPPVPCLMEHLALDCDVALCLVPYK